MVCCPIRIRPRRRVSVPQLQRNPYFDSFGLRRRCPSSAKVQPIETLRSRPAGDAMAQSRDAGSHPVPINKRLSKFSRLTKPPKIVRSARDRSDSERAARRARRPHAPTRRPNSDSKDREWPLPGIEDRCENGGRRRNALVKRQRASAILTTSPGFLSFHRAK